MFNDNLGAVTAGWSSLDGQEEKYSEYFVTADLTVIPNANNYDVVSGGSIAQGDDYYYLSVSPAAKIGYIYLPNKTRVQTNGGGVATAAYTGISGDITFYIDKTASSFLIKYLSDLTSAVISTSPAVSAFQDCYLGSLIANNSTDVNLVSDNVITYLRCKNSHSAGAIDCQLTKESIASILSDAVILGGEFVLNVSGGTNAPASTWSTQAIADKGTIISRGGVVIFNA